MDYVVAIAAVCPMRSEPSHKSEMVSQLLLGEAGEMLEEQGDFTKIRCLYDEYEGWCTNSQLVYTTHIEALQPTGYITQRNATALLNGANINLALATPVYNKLTIGNYTTEFDESVMAYARLPQALTGVVVQQLAWPYINTPYLWGGKSNFGIDCSGFTQQVFKMAGTPLLRDAYQQATQGQPVNSLQEAACGDLAYFDNEQGRITHVGILLNNNTIIHASGYVRVDSINDEGITNSVTGKKTHRLKEVRRMETSSSWLITPYTLSLKPTS